MRQWARWTGSVIIVGVLILGLMTVGLMVSYDLRHADELACAPYERNSGPLHYPCGREQPFYLHPSGLALLGALLSGQPEPTPQLVMPP